MTMRLHNLKYRPGAKHRTKAFELGVDRLLNGLDRGCDTVQSAHRSIANGRVAARSAREHVSWWHWKDRFWCGGNSRIYQESLQTVAAP